MSNSKYMTCCNCICTGWKYHKTLCCYLDCFPLSNLSMHGFLNIYIVSILIRRSFPTCPSRGWSWTVHCPRNPSRAFQSSCWGWNFVWQLPWRSRDLQLDPMVRPEVCNPNSFGLSFPKNSKGVLGVQRVGQNFAHQNHYTLPTIQPNLNCKIKSKAATATLSIKTPPWSSIERSTYSVSHWSILCLSRSRRGMQIH